MFKTDQNGRFSMKKRAASISAQKLENLNRNEPKKWGWDPDEVTGLGNISLLKECLLPGMNLQDTKTHPTDEEDADTLHDFLAELLCTAWKETVDLHNVFVKVHKRWGELMLHPERFEFEGYPTRKQYTWRSVKKKKDGSKSDVIVVLRVSEYIDRVFEFLLDQMKNPAVFPQDDISYYPSDFREHARKMNTLLFRVIAILFSNEHPSVHNLTRSLKLLLKRVLYYSWVWDLISDKETACISYLVEPIREQFNIDCANLGETRTLAEAEAEIDEI